MRTGNHRDCRLPRFHLEGRAPDTGGVARKDLKQVLIAVNELRGIGGKHFQDPYQFAFFQHRNDEHGPHAEAARCGGIHAGIGFRVETELRLTSPQAGSGKAVAGIERNPEIGRVFAMGRDIPPSAELNKLPVDSVAEVPVTLLPK